MELRETVHILESEIINGNTKTGPDSEQLGHAWVFYRDMEDDCTGRTLNPCIPYL